MMKIESKEPALAKTQYFASISGDLFDIIISNDNKENSNIKVI